jgi:glutathionyl-hydroquinone reductase
MLVDRESASDVGRVSAPETNGTFIRPVSTFRDWITPDGSAGPTGRSGFKAEAGRYHLYVALSCPWASRTLVVRKLKRLQNLISISVAEPASTEQGWRFGDYPGADRDTLNGITYLRELYTRVNPEFTGRATVPVLWDRQTKTIVNNESADIVRMLNSAFEAIAEPTFDLYPEGLRNEIDAWNDRIYPSLNNGVYRAGFATTQKAYEEAFQGVFAMLDELEQHLATRQLLVRDRMTEADIWLFVTLIRFDAAYHGLFKCNLRRIADYPALSAYLRRLLEIPSIRETVNIDHIKRGYYSIKALNPNGIVPSGPDLRSIGLA